MNGTLRDVLGRCDRSLVLALGVVLATLSASAGVVGAARSSAESVRTVRVLEPVVRVVTTPVFVPQVRGSLLNISLLDRVKAAVRVRQPLHRHHLGAIGLDR